MKKEFDLNKEKKFFCKDDECSENAQVFEFHDKIIVYPEDKVKEFIKRLKDKKIVLVHHGEEGTSCFVNVVRIEEIDKLARGLSE